MSKTCLWMPVQTVAIHVERNRVNQSVDGSNNLPARRDNMLVSDLSSLSHRRTVLPPRRSGRPGSWWRPDCRRWSRSEHPRWWLPSSASRSSWSTHSSSRQTPACSCCRHPTRWRSWRDRWSSGRPSCIIRLGQDLFPRDKWYFLTCKAFLSHFWRALYR